MLYITVTMKKDNQLNIRLDKEEVQGIEAIRKATGQTKSALLRKYLKLGIQHELEQITGTTSGKKKAKK